MFCVGKAELQVEKQALILLGNTHLDHNKGDRARTSQVSYYVQVQ